MIGSCEEVEHLFVLVGHRELYVKERALWRETVRKGGHDDVMIEVMIYDPGDDVSSICEVAGDHVVSLPSATAQGNPVEALTNTFVLRSTGSKCSHGLKSKDRMPVVMSAA